MRNSVKKLLAVALSAAMVVTPFAVSKQTAKADPASMVSEDSPYVPAGTIVHLDGGEEGGSSIIGKGYNKQTIDENGWPTLTAKVPSGYQWVNFCTFEIPDINGDDVPAGTNMRYITITYSGNLEFARINYVHDAGKDTETLSGFFSWFAQDKEWDTETTPIVCVGEPVLSGIHKTVIIDMKATFEAAKTQIDRMATEENEEPTTAEEYIGINFPLTYDNFQSGFHLHIGDPSQKKGSDGLIIEDAYASTDIAEKVAPTTEAPTTEEPTTQEPTTEEPTTQEPTTEAPTEEPTTQEPTTEASTQEPTTEAPTQEPTTEAPTTEAPTTEAPTTEAPTTEAPTTEAPTTEAPTTQPPTTEAPTQEPTTQAPTQEPTTEVVTTQPATSEISTTEPVTGGEETTTDEPLTDEGDDSGNQEATSGSQNGGSSDNDGSSSATVTTNNAAGVTTAGKVSTVGKSGGVVTTGKTTPKTGDSEKPMTMAGMMIVLMVALGVVIYRRRETE